MYNWYKQILFSKLLFLGVQQMVMNMKLKDTLFVNTLIKMLTIMTKLPNPTTETRICS